LFICADRQHPLGIGPWRIAELLLPAAQSGSAAAAKARPFMDHTPGQSHQRLVDHLAQVDNHEDTLA
jgi:hypothetical protein